MLTDCKKLTGDYSAPRAPLVFRGHNVVSTLKIQLCLLYINSAMARGGALLLILLATIAILVPCGMPMRAGARDRSVFYVVAQVMQLRQMGRPLNEQRFWRGSTN